MAYVTGTATDYKDLLARLRAFATTNATLVAAGQQWAELRYTTGAGEHELILKGPGLAGYDEVYIGIRTESDAVNDWYNWQLYGFTGYEGASVITLQPGVTYFASGTPKILLSNGNIKYWFVANGRRIVVIAKVSTVYEAAYLGLIVPYGPPTSYPYPLFIGGSYCQHGDTTLPRWSCATMHHNNFPWAAGRYEYNSKRESAGAAFFYGGWLPVRTGFFSAAASSVLSSTTFEGLQPDAAMISPFCEAVRANYDNSSSFSRSPGPPFAGQYPVCPAVLMKGTAGKNVFGELDGIFWTPGFSLLAEDTVVVGSDSYMAVSNVFRSGPADYFLLKLG